jgi:hypothetical protein
MMALRSTKFCEPSKASESRNSKIRDCSRRATVKQNYHKSKIGTEKEKMADVEKQNDTEQVMEETIENTDKVVEETIEMVDECKEEYSWKTGYSSKGSLMANFSFLSMLSNFSILSIMGFASIFCCTSAMSILSTVSVEKTNRKGSAHRLSTLSLQYCVLLIPSSILFRTLLCPS